MDPKIDSELAGIVTKLLSQEMDRATKVESLSKFARPENCERINVSRTNPGFLTVKKEIKTGGSHDAKDLKTTRCND